MRLLLVTSRDTKRWVVPKGNPIAGLAPHDAAAHEAFEEAGVTGFIEPDAFGSYRYGKRLADGTVRVTTVQLYRLAYVAQLDDWPERAERETRWFTPSDAADSVEEDDLAAILRGFAVGDL